MEMCGRNSITLIQGIFQVESLDIINHSLPFQRIQCARATVNDRDFVDCFETGSIGSSHNQRIGNNIDWDDIGLISNIYRKTSICAACRSIFRSTFFLKIVDVT